MSPERRRLARGRARRLAVIAVVLVGVGVYASFRLLRATDMGLAGKEALLRAEASFHARELQAAQGDLALAERSFTRMGQEFRALGPLPLVAKALPFIRMQVRGVEAFSDAGALVSSAGLELVEAARSVDEPSAQQTPASRAMEALRTIHRPLRSGKAKVDAAIERVESLDGYRLVGPLAEAHEALAVRLPEIGAMADSAEQGVAALISFLGGSGPRRYLLFSQNPEEVRPTGGFMGVYGVLSTGQGGLGLERLAPIETWTAAHPDAVVPPGEATSAFRFYTPPFPQTLANVNTVPDWPTVSRLAMSLWERGGEPPVQGVVSVSPGFLARVIGAVGPVVVPSYGETVTEANLVERMDFYTRQAEQGAVSQADRKEFIVELAEVVLQRLLEAPAAQWDALAGAVGAAFDAREAMVWSQDADVAATLAARRWDGAFPSTIGDFFYNAELAYESKNGRYLRRTFDHHVELREDGSGVVTTVMTLANTDAPRPLNPGAPIYVTIYGPAGATLDPATPADAREPALAGHPAAAWFRAAPPLGETSVKVVWQVPRLAAEHDDGSRAYALWWMRVPDHQGDVLNLRVDLPTGWRWKAEPPPAQLDLTTDVIGTWGYERG